MAAGPRRGWLRSRAAAAGRIHTPRELRCRREVCPGAEVYCPPWRRSYTLSQQERFKNTQKRLSSTSEALAVRERQK